MNFVLWKSLRHDGKVGIHTWKQLLLRAKFMELKRDIARRLTQKSEGMLSGSRLRLSPAQRY